MSPSTMPPLREAPMCGTHVVDGVEAVLPMKDGDELSLDLDRLGLARRDLIDLQTGVNSAMQGSGVRGGCGEQHVI